MTTTENKTIQDKEREKKRGRLAPLLACSHVDLFSDDWLGEEPLTLPADRTKLVTAYALLGLDEKEGEEIIEKDKKRNLLRSLSDDGRDAVYTGKRLYKAVGHEETCRYLNALSAIKGAEGVRRAENFVDVKRRLLRKVLFKAVVLQVCYYMNEYEKDHSQGLPPTLKTELRTVEYNPDSQRIGADVLTAIRNASGKYLDSLEEILLNGIKTEIYFHDKGCGAENRKTIVIKDKYDEAYTYFEPVYMIFKEAVTSFYLDMRCKEMTDFTEFCYAKMKEGKYFKDWGVLSDTKFNEVIGEEKKC